MIESLQTAVELISLLRIPGLSEFLPNLLYVGLGIIFLVSLFLLIKRLLKKREYISPSYEYYEISENVKIHELLKDIYEKQIKKYGEKEYIVLEYISLNGDLNRILRLKTEIFTILEGESKGMLNPIRIKKEYNHEILHKMSSENTYVELETRTDFALPYIPYLTQKGIDKGKNIVQICLRPVKKGWNKDLQVLQKGLLKGYDETLRWTGCIGGFVGVFYPIVKLLDTQSSTKNKNYEIEIPKSKFVNKRFEDKYNLIEQKKSEIGFDVSIRLVLPKKEEISILESIFKVLNTNIEDDSNSFVISKRHNFTGKYKDKVIRAYQPENSVDLLNIDEISEVIKRIIL